MVNVHFAVLIGKPVVDFLLVIELFSLDAIRLPAEALRAVIDWKH